MSHAFFQRLILIPAPARGLGVSHGKANRANRRILIGRFVRDVGNRR